MDNPKNNIPRQSREELEAEYGQVWDRPEFFRDFQILGRLGPYVAVKRKSDGQKGNVECDDTFHLFFNFRPAT